MRYRSLALSVATLALAVAWAGERPSGQDNQANELVVRLRVRAVARASGTGVSDIVAAGELMHRHEVSILDELVLTYDGERRWRVEAPSEAESGLVAGDDGSEPVGDGAYTVSGGGKRSEHIAGMADGWTQLKTANANWAYGENAAANRMPIAIADGGGTLKDGFVLQVRLLSAALFDAVQASGTERIQEHKKGRRQQTVGTRDYKTVAHQVLANAQDERFRGQLQVTVDRKLPRFRYSGRASYTKDEPIELVQQGSGHARRRVSVEVDYTVSYNMPDEDVEAELIPDPGYASWMPEAGASEDADGNQLGVRVELHRKGQPAVRPATKATFKFELHGVSQEKGVSLNAPTFDRAKEDADLRIDALESPDLKVEPDGQSAVSTSPGHNVRVVVRSHDWGAHGRLRVTATLDGGETLTAFVRGRPKQKLLSIPLDDNGNHIADAFERHFRIYSRNLPGNWDGAENPKNQRTDGDGITLYEKYRGFEFSDTHERLDPHAKYVFIHDPDDVVKFAASDPLTAETGFARVSGLKVRYVDDDHWTGPGSHADGKRIVNFNYGTASATEQTALDVVIGDKWARLEPPGWTQMLEKYGKGLPRPEAFPGLAYPDVEATFGSPRNTYQIVISRALIRNALEEHAAKHMNSAPELEAAQTELERFASQHDASGQEMAYALKQRLFPDSVSAKEARAQYPNRPAAWMTELLRLYVAIIEAKRRVAEELKTYKAEHPDEWYGMNARMLALVGSHELTHGVGVQHHESTSAGSRACVMRYLSGAWDNCPKDPDDAYDMRFYAKWPDLICRQGEETHGGKGCWIQMIVTDRPEVGSAATDGKGGGQ